MSTETANCIEEEILQALAGALEETHSTVKTSSKGKSKSKNNSTKNKSASELENLLDSEDIEVSDAKTEDPLDSVKIKETVDYSSLAEQFHFEQIHYAEMDSEYLLKASVEHEAKYKEWEEEVEYVMEGSETMDEVEAEDAIQEVITKAVLGGDELSFDKKRRLDNWIKFNSSLFALYESTAVIRTNNVNYAPW